MIEEIKARLDIVAALEHFGVSVPARGGDPVMVRCPWHEDRTPSMAVYRHKGRAWCYGCNRGGDALDVTAHFLQGDLRDAVTYWRELLGLASPTTSREVRQRAQEARRRQEERHYRALARLASREAERGLPRPRREEDIDLYDRIYGVKDAIDDADRVYNIAGTISYLQDLVRWRRDSLRLLGLYGIGEGRGDTHHVVPPGTGALMCGTDEMIVAAPGVSRGVGG